MSYSATRRAHATRTLGTTGIPIPEHEHELQCGLQNSGPTSQLDQLPSKRPADNIQEYTAMTSVWGLNTYNPSNFPLLGTCILYAYISLQMIGCTMLLHSCMASTTPASEGFNYPAQRRSPLLPQSALSVWRSMNGTLAQSSQSHYHAVTPTVEPACAA